MKRLIRHLPHYLSLFGILIAGVLGFWFFSYNRLFQVAIAVSVAVSYVVWGIVHHLIHDDLHPSVVAEYLFIAALGLVIVFSLVFRV